MYYYIWFTYLKLIECINVYWFTKKIGMIIKFDLKTLPCHIPPSLWLSFPSETNLWAENPYFPGRKINVLIIILYYILDYAYINFRPAQFSFSFFFYIFLMLWDTGYSMLIVMWLGQTYVMWVGDFRINSLFEISSTDYRGMFQRCILVY